MIKSLASLLLCAVAASATTAANTIPSNALVRGDAAMVAADNALLHERVFAGSTTQQSFATTLEQNDDALLHARVGAGSDMQQTAFSAAVSQKNHGPHGHDPHNHDPHNHSPIDYAELAGKAAERTGKAVAEAAGKAERGAKAAAEHAGKVAAEARAKAAAEARAKEAQWKGYERGAKERVAKDHERGAKEVSARRLCSCSCAIII